MQVAEHHWGNQHEYIDVKGSPSRGYRITRQVLTDTGETETQWQLTPEQSRQLRATLSERVTSDRLTPKPDVEPNFASLVVSALEGLVPPAEPHTWWSFD